ncbi:hypothetical protein S100141_03743 [Bacillus licheniformis]|nr:hypothetical protein S100141_03743 [Bacillus licheniformis]
MKKNLLIIGLVMLLCIVVSACGSGNASNGSKEKAAEKRQEHINQRVEA